MSQLAQTVILPVLAFLTFAAGCSRPTALVPPKIHYGTETCADCGMIIGEPHYAAALAWHATTDDSIQMADFDDIGCLLNWHRHHANIQIIMAWVKDVQTATWLEASSARYIRNERLATPMGSGVAAGATETDFAALPVRQPTLTWSDLLKAESPADAPAQTGLKSHAD